MMNPLPSFSQVYGILIQEEKQREIQAASHFTNDSVSMNASANVSIQSHNNFKGKNDGKKIICSNCKKPGHPAIKCYRLIGFPKDFKFTKGMGVVANACGEQDDMAQVTQPGVQTGFQSGSNFSGILPGMIQEMYGNLLNMLSTTKVSGNSAAGPSSSNASVSQPFCSANFAGPFLEEPSGSW